MYVYSYIGRKGIGEIGREKKMGGEGGGGTFKGLLRVNIQRRKKLYVYVYIIVFTFK